MKNNTRNKREMTKGEQVLVLGAMEMVDGMVGRYAGQGVAREDLQQEGYLYLCYAAMDFDESRGVLFTTFAFNYVRKGMQDLVRQCKFGNVSASSTEEELAQVPSPKCDEADYALMKAEEAGVLMAAMERLTQREQMVITALYGLKGKKKRVNELSLQLGLTPGQIYKAEQRALRRLGCMLEDTI